jgi:hypothetical protein
MGGIFAAVLLKFVEDLTGYMVGITMIILISVYRWADTSLDTNSIYILFGI